MSDSRSGHVPEAVREAAAWLARLNDPAATEADRQAFLAWMKASPVHVRHYLELTRLEVDLRSPALYEGWDLAVHVEDAAPNVVAFPARARDAGDAPARVRGRPAWRGWAVAASLSVMTVLAGWWAFSDLPTVEHYTSAPGELRRVTLEDGSSMTLNARSNTTVRYDVRFRQVQLDLGEVLFSVTPDPARPFRVRVGNNVIQAVGTEFNVRRRGGEVLLTVVAGRVIVSSAAATMGSAGAVPGGLTPERVEVGAGQQFAIPMAGLDGQGQSRVRDLDEDALARSTLWIQHRVAFDRVPVGEVVEELNLHNREQLVVDDPVLASRRVSGTFDIRQPAALVALLQQQDAVVLEPVEGGGLRLVPSPDAARRR